MSTLVLRSRNRLLVEQAIETLKAERPMTLRQLYYRLISAGFLGNHQKEYNRLKAVMGRLREEGVVPRTWIVDHVRTTFKPSSWSGLSDYGESVRECYRKNFWASLDCHVEILVEKDAVAGTIQPITSEYDVALRVLRGYSSISFAGEIADEWAEIEKPIYAYYLGDYDPSGMDIERDVREKIERYGNCEFKWSRLAILEADFDEFDLIPLPIKHSDKRAASFLDQHGKHCAELDALPPTELRRRVEEAIQRHVEQDEWERLQRIEALEKQSMQEYVDKWSVA